MGAVDLSFVSIAEAWLACAAEIESRVSLVIDLNFSSVLEVLVWTFSANQHGCRTGTSQRTVHYFPLAVFLANFFPTLQGLAVKQ